MRTRKEMEGWIKTNRFHGGNLESSFSFPFHFESVAGLDDPASSSAPRTREA